MQLPPLGTVHYWRGIKESLEQAGCHRVVITRVPRTASIIERAEILRQQISTKCEPGEPLNLLGHSMVVFPKSAQHKTLMEGWIRCALHDLDAQTQGIEYSELNNNFYSSSASPSSTQMLIYSGSTFADYVLSYFIAPQPISTTRTPEPLPFFRFLQHLGIQTAAFQDLTTTNMQTLNKLVVDREDVRYFSFGASFNPTWGSVFRASHDIIEEKEGENDGLVSVSSAMWGEYKGTLQNVNHLDIINWVRVPLWGNWI